MRRYTTIDHRVLDLGNLTEEQEAFLRRCYHAFLRDTDWDTMSNLVAGDENPLIREAGGLITRAVWDHPLFQAVRDLEDRAGLKQGDLRPDEGGDFVRGPRQGESVGL